MELVIPKGTILKDVHANIDELDADSIKVLTVGHHEKNYVSCPLQGADLQLLKDMKFWLFEFFLDKNDINFGCEYSDMGSENGTLIQYIEISTVIGFASKGQS